MPPAMHPHLHPRKEYIDLDLLNLYVVLTFLAPVTKTGDQLSHERQSRLQPFHGAAQDNPCVTDKMILSSGKSCCCTG